MDDRGILAADLERLSPPHRRTELIRGHMVVREPPGTWHGALSARLTRLLGNFAEEHGLGVVFGQDTGFQIASQPDTVRAPDTAFVARARLEVVGDRGYALLAPDLVAEVLSPDDRAGEVLAKVADWLEAGTRLVWVIDPTRRTARAYRADGTEQDIGPRDDLDGEDVLPGFRCGLGALLAPMKKGG